MRHEVDRVGPGIAAPVDAGIDRQSLEHVHAPLGINIGSQTVPEIAVSICAELVSHRNRDGFVPGRPDGVNLSE